MKKVLPAAIVIAIVFAGCATSAGSADNQQMTRDDVIALAKKGVSDNVIVNQIRATRSTFQLSNDDLITLKDAGVSDRVVNFMLNRAGEQQSSGYYYAPYYSYPFFYGSFSWNSPFYYGRPHFYSHFGGPHYSYYHLRSRVRR